MARYIGEKRITPYYGDGRPVNSYQNGKKLAGWREAFQTGLDLSFDDTYNDTVGLELSGRSMQPQDYYREVASSNVIPITAHKENSLRSARIDTLAQQTSRYYRELSGSGILSESDNDEVSARRVRIDATALQTSMYYREPTPTAGVLSFSDNNETVARKAVVSTVAKQTVTVQGKNLFDKAKATIGYYLSGNGNIAVLANAFVSAYIRVSGGTVYVLNSVISVCFFDSGKNFISTVFTASFTTPATCAFVRFDGSMTGIDTAQLELGSSATTYAPFIPNSPSIDYPAPIAPAVAAGGSVKATRCAKNRFNKAAITANKYVLGTDGLLYGSTVSDTSEYVAITPSQEYYLSGCPNYTMQGIVWYTKEKAYINYVSANNGLKTAPSNAYFCRFSMTHADVNTAQFELGTSATPYEPYSGADYTGAFTNAAYGLTGAPDTRDLVSGREVHNTALIILDGITYKASNVVATYSDGNIRLTVLGYASAKQETSIISSHLTPGIVSGGIYLGQNQAFSIIIAGATLGVTSDASNADKVTACNNWLASKVTAGDPIKVLYVLATPLILSNSPQTIALNTTLNNCFSDTGTLMVAYQVKPGSNLAGDILSPHPDYPAPIAPAIALGGSGKVSRTGKNIFNTQAWYNWLRTFTTVYVSKATVDSVSCIYYRPAATYDKQWMFGKFTANTRYTIRFRAKGIIGPNDSTGFIFEYTDGSLLYGVVANSDSWSDYTLTSAAGKTVSCIRMGYGYGQGCYFDENSIQLEVGASATAYEAFGTDYPATPQAAMYGLSGAPDSYGLVDGKEVHRTKKILLNGTEAWSLYTSVEKHFQFVVNDNYYAAGDSNNAKSNYYPSNLVSNYFSSADYSVMSVDGNRIRIKDARFSDVASFKADLAAKYAAGNPVEVVYRLATPVVYSNTPQSVALSTTGVNNLFSDVGSLFFAYQVKVGSNIAGDIASPTPDYPAPISPAIALGGSGKVFRRKKNLYPFTINYLKTNNDNSISTNYYSVTLKVLANTAYTVQVNVTTAEPYGWLYMLGATGAFASITSTGIKSVTVNSRANGTISVGLSIQAWGDGTSGSGGDISYVSNLQLEQGSIATPYEPYSGSDTTLTPQAAMYGLTGAVDSIGADGVEKHPTKKYTFTGNETLYASSAQTLANGFRAYFQPSGIDRNYENGSAVCSHFAFRGITGNLVGISVTNVIFFQVLLSTIGALDTDSDATKVTKLKAFLTAQNAASTPVEIVYQLSTPTTYSNSPQTVSLSDGLNNVFSDVGTLNVAYQVSDNQNIAGDIASPTPTYPAIIIPSSGLIQVEGRNLCPKMSLVETVSAGITFTPLENGGVRVSGTATTLSAYLLYATSPETVFFTLTAWKRLYPCADNQESANVRLVLYGKDDAGVSRWITPRSTSELPYNVHIQRVYIQVESGTTVNDMVIFQFFSRASGLHFMSYRPILTQQSSDLRAIPDGAGGWIARDTETIEWVGGERHRVVTRRVGHYVCTGASGENWFSPNTVTGCLSYDLTLSPSKPLDSTKMLCSHFPVVQIMSFDPNTIRAYTGYTEVAVTLKVELLASNDLAGFKGYFAKQYANGTPVTIDYVLATPITIDLGPVDLPTYLYHTRIRTSGTYPPDVKATCKVVDTAV